MPFFWYLFIFCLPILFCSGNNDDKCSDQEIDSIQNQFKLESNGFCHSLFSSNETILPLKNLSCLGSADSRFIFLKSVVGSVGKSCGTAISLLACFSFFSTEDLSFKGVSLPCISNGSKVLNYIESKCSFDEVILKIDAVKEVAILVDNLLLSNPNLTLACRPIDLFSRQNWKPDNFICPSYFTPRTKDYGDRFSTGCVLECPSPFFDKTQWSNLRALNLILQLISCIFCFGIVFKWSLNPEKNKFPASMVKHILLSLGIFHFSLLIPPLAQYFTNDSGAIFCENNVPADSSNGGCLFQGGLISFGLKSFRNWWVCIVFNLYLLLVKGIKSTPKLEPLYFMVGYGLQVFFFLFSVGTKDVYYLQGTFSCSAYNSQPYDNYIFVLLGLGLTLKLLLHLRKIQTRLGIALSRAKVFSLKLLIIVIIVNLALFSVIIFIINDPGFTTETPVTGFVEWRNCRYSNYLNALSKNETVDYISCKDLEKLSYATSRGQITIVGLIGLFVSVVLVTKSETLLGLVCCKCLKDSVKSQKKFTALKSSSTSKSTGSGNSNNKQVQLVRTESRKIRNSTKQIRTHSSGIAFWAQNEITSSSTYDVIIIGGGIAAGYAARELVNIGIKPHQVAIFSAESIAPYERPYLTKEYLATTQIKNGSLYTCKSGNQTFQNEEWYKTQGIDLYLKTKIVSFDPLLLAIKDHLGKIYQATSSIIIATGSCTLKLPITNIIQAKEDNNKYISPEDPNLLRKTPKNLYYIRTFEDAQNLRERLSKHISETSNSKIPSCLVIGGSYIGLECASAAALKGWLVTIVVRGNSLYSTLFGPQLSSLFENYLIERGVKIIKQAPCNTLLSDCGSIIGCRLEDGTFLYSDITIVGIGSVPNVELFKDKLLFQTESSRPSILVDNNYQASCQGVYAVGDVAASPFRSFGLFQLQHAEHARYSGSYVVHHIFGKDTESIDPYHPHISSQVFDLKWNFFGDNSGRTFKMFGDLETKLLALWIWDNKIQGAVVVSGTEHDISIIQNVTKLRKTVNLKQINGLTDVEQVFLYLLRN